MEIKELLFYLEDAGVSGACVAWGSVAGTMMGQSYGLPWLAVIGMAGFFFFIRPKILWA